MHIKVTIPLTYARVRLYVSSEVLITGVTYSSAPGIHCFLQNTEDFWVVDVCSADATKALSHYVSDPILLLGAVQGTSVKKCKVACVAFAPTETSLGFTGEELRDLFVVSSIPYPIFPREEIVVDFPKIIALTNKELVWPVEGLNLGAPSIADVTLRNVLRAYKNGEPEEIDFRPPEILDVTLRTILKKYENWEPEELLLSGPEVKNVEVRRVLIRYGNWEPEELTMSPPAIASIELHQ